MIDRNESPAEAAPASPHFLMRLQTALSACPHLPGSEVRIDASHDRVVLRGVVNSYFQKQLAQETIRRVEGVSEVRNDLVVRERSRTLAAEPIRD